ncbi:MAG: hypothetical protein C0392_14630 [Syntrophus sp. (in: bacteria)]|nr:hypothetical protein [Syntrophus sp. (in: bacteria)]
MSIAIVGMLDERGKALAVIKNQIEENGLKTCLIDVSIETGATISSLRADVSAREIAELGQRSDKVTKPSIAGTGHNTVASLMAEGLKRKVSALHASGELEGIIAIAGMTGTLMTLKAMRVLPFGLPKLLLSSTAALPAYTAQLAEYFALKDVTVMHTVIDTVGMNHLVRTLAINGANAISGMVKSRALQSPTEVQKKPSLAITEFGFCDKGAHYVRQILNRDYEIVSIHATGFGDRAAIDLVSQGCFHAFIDLVPATFSEYILGGNRALGPDRLDIAMDQKIPYIFCPGGFDMISCGPIERRDTNDHLWVSRRLSERKLHVKDSLRVEARTSVEEMKQLGAAVALKLNQYKNKELVKVLIPRKGFSSLSIEGGHLFDPDADKAFARALRYGLDPHIDMADVDADINDPEFAQAIAAALQRAIAHVDADIERSPG